MKFEMVLSAGDKHQACSIWPTMSALPAGRVEACPGSRTSAPAADALEPGGGSGVFRDEGVLVGCARGVGFNRRRLVLSGSGRRVVASQSFASALDRATVRSCGNSALRARAERQHGDNIFISISFAGTWRSVSPDETRRMRSVARQRQAFIPRRYFFFVEAKSGCHDTPFWLGAAAMVLILGFLGFLASRLPLCSPLAMSLSLWFDAD
jgi:hypothetical protein